MSASNPYPSWGRFPDGAPARAVRPAWRHQVPDPAALAPVLPYGLGRSYGDACLNAGGTVLDTRGLDRLLAFDAATGVLRAEAGTSLAEVLEVALPRGWFLPVTPGTKFVTLGGAIAHDVHGKNHHVAGTFGRYVRRLALLRSGGETLELGPEDALFRATVGGLGLTGLILWAEVQLQQVQSDQIQMTRLRFGSPARFLALSEAYAGEPYTMAWVDGTHPAGRGVFMAGHHAPAGPGAGLPAPGGTLKPRLAAPLDAPGWLLNPLSVRAFNAAYHAAGRPGQHRVHFEPCFYPLDAVGRWNRLYGRRGFLQYQSVVPFETAGAAVPALLRRVAKSGAASFLAVLKTFGDVPSPGLMSFPRPGVTLALDFPMKGERTLRLVRELNAVAVDAGGALYPAKDATMTPDEFRRSFPAWERFAAFVDPAFSSSFWRRVTADAADHAHG